MWGRRRRWEKAGAQRQLGCPIDLLGAWQACWARDQSDSGSTSASAAPHLLLMARASAPPSSTLIMRVVAGSTAAAATSSGSALTSPMAPSASRIAQNLGWRKG